MAPAAWGPDHLGDHGPRGSGPLRNTCSPATSVRPEAGALLGPEVPPAQQRVDIDVGAPDAGLRVGPLASTIRCRYSPCREPNSSGGVAWSARRESRYPVVDGPQLDPGLHGRREEPHERQAVRVSRV